jgi:peptidoglycan hydrolase-like protein with peptidoglycan-binding domain
VAWFGFLLDPSRSQPDDPDDNQKGNFAMATIPRLAPGATGEIVKALQHALIANGYSVGPDGANGIFDEGTTTALEAFQDNAALPVQPLCDQACWTALYSAKRK